MKHIALIFVATTFSQVLSVQAEITTTDESKSKESTLFDNLSAAGFSLSRAATGPDAGDPASFGFVNDIGNSTEYNADFILSYSVPSSLHWGASTISPAISVEGHLNSSDDTAQNSWIFRGGIEFDIPLGNEIVITDPIDPTFPARTTTENQLYVSINAKNETDRDFDGS